MNLADLSNDERLAMEADKTACFIRHQCRHLHGRQRQVCALKLLSPHSEEHQERIKAAMAKRAGR